MAENGLRKVLFILVSEEQLSQLVLHPTVMMHWPSMRLPAAHCLTNASLLEALGSACNPRGGPNVYKFEPEGLASGEYELRQTMNGQDHRTTYWLVAQGSPALVGGADNAALERSNLSQAGNPETSPSTACVAPRPVNTFNDLCVIAVRSSCSYCSTPVHQHVERSKSKTEPPPKERMKVHSVCSKHRGLQEKKVKVPGLGTISELERLKLEKLSEDQKQGVASQQLQERLEEVRRQRSHNLERGASVRRTPAANSRAVAAAAMAARGCGGGSCGGSGGEGGAAPKHSRRLRSKTHIPELVGLQEEGLQVHTEQSTAPEVPPGNSGAAGSGVLPGLPGPSAGAASEWPEGYVYPPGGPTSTQSDLKRKALDDLDEYDLDDFLARLEGNPDMEGTITRDPPMMIIGEPPFDDDMPLFPPDKNPDASPQDQPGDEQFPNNSLQYNSLPYGTIHLQQHPQPHEYPQWYNQGCPQQPEWQQQQQQQQGWLPTHSNSYQPEAAGPYQHQQASYQQHPRQSHQPQAGPPWPYFNQPGQQFQQGPPEQEPAPEHLLLRPTDLWPSPDGLSGGPPCSPGQNQEEEFPWQLLDPPRTPKNEDDPDLDPLGKFSPPPDPRGF